MTERRNVGPSRKRISKALDQDYWDCSVCTYSNSPEAFKCSMCDVRKGTSTRKPRLNQHIVAQQEATRLVAQAVPLSPSLSHKDEDFCEKQGDSPIKTKRHRLKGVDRSSPMTMAVTVNNVTVLFTEFRPKKATLECDEKIKS
ncbi:RING1 and YY1-binding protein [Ciona intestinalis]